MAINAFSQTVEFGYRVKVTTDPDYVANFDRVVLPGKGAFAVCARELAALSGMLEALETATGQGKLFLGICVGMQLMAEHGLEHRITPGFGWIPGDIAEMPALGLGLPQIGPNGFRFTPGAHRRLEGFVPGDHAYLVLSLALVGGDPSFEIAVTDYGGPVAAMVAVGNSADTQIHVEQSQEGGPRILVNFLHWTP